MTINDVTPGPWSEPGPDDPEPNPASSETAKKGASDDPGNPAAAGSAQHPTWTPSPLGPEQAKALPGLHALLPLSRRERRRLARAAKRAAKAREVVTIIPTYRGRLQVDLDRLAASLAAAKAPAPFGGDRRAHFPKWVKYVWVPLSGGLFVLIDSRLLTVLHLFPNVAMLVGGVAALSMEGLAFMYGHAHAEEHNTVTPAELAVADRWALRYAQLIAIGIQTILGAIRAASGAPISAVLYATLGFALWRASVFVYAKTSSRTDDLVARDQRAVKKNRRYISKLLGVYHGLRGKHAHDLRSVADSSTAVLTHYYEGAAAVDAAVIRGGGKAQPWPVFPALTRRIDLASSKFQEFDDTLTFPDLTDEPTTGPEAPRPLDPGHPQLGTAS